MMRHAIVACVAAFLLGTAPAEEPKKDLEARARSFVDLLQKGSFKEAADDFNDAVRKAMPAEKLDETWKAVIAGVGALKKVAGTRKEKVEAYDVVFVTCEFEKALLDVRLVYD